MPNSPDIFSTVNSTMAPLPPNGVFTGVFEAVNTALSVNIQILSDADSAVHGLELQWSVDGLSEALEETGTISAGITQTYNIDVRAPYFRIIYTNGSSAQTKFRLAAFYRFSEDVIISIDSKLPTLGQKTVFDSIPVTIASDQPPIKIAPNGSTLPVSGLVQSQQAGVWNIGNITGAVSLPTGASTAAKQDTGNSSLAAISSQALLLSSSGSTVTSVSASTTSVTLLNSNSSRKGACVFNDSASNLYIKCGVTASTSSYTIKLLSGGFVNIFNPVYLGRIDGIWDTAVGAARITELT